ncbi:MAG: hypothetical protein JST42_21645, partial [Bacteroidetes bacterium]|nr:hypothetical protein [Bacteroidota bacterium]
TGPASFIVERSGDGGSFKDLVSLAADGDLNEHGYSWTDEHPLTGKNFYRIKVSESGEADYYSPIVSVTNISTGWTIGRLYQAAGSTWNIEILADRDIRLQLRIVDAGGRQFMQHTVALSPSSRLISVNLSALASGQYFVQLVSDLGEVSVRAIQKQ